MSSSGVGSLKIADDVDAGKACQEAEVFLVDYRPGITFQSADRGVGVEPDNQEIT